MHESALTYKEIDLRDGGPVFRAPFCIKIRDIIIRVYNGMCDLKFIEF